MAYFGLSKLAAVNRIAQLCNLNERVTALDSTGTWPSKTYGASDAGQIEQDLDEVKAQVLARGYQCNTRRNQKYTRATQGAITLPDNTLKIIPTGPSELRNHTIFDNKVYDLEPTPPTDQLAPGDYFYHIVVDIDFDSLEPTVKQLVVAEASRIIQRRRRGDPRIDMYLADEVAAAELAVSRSKQTSHTYPINPQPVMPRVATGAEAP